MLQVRVIHPCFYDDAETGRRRKCPVLGGIVEERHFRRGMSHVPSTYYLIDSLDTFIDSFVATSNNSVGFGTSNAQPVMCIRPIVFAVGNTAFIEMNSFKLLNFTQTSFGMCLLTPVNRDDPAMFTLVDSSKFLPEDLSLLRYCPLHKDIEDIIQTLVSSS